MTTSDVVICGAGIYGTLTALSLAERGLSVTLIDAHEPSFPAAASSGLTRVAHTLYDHPDYVALAQSSLQLYRDLCPTSIHPCDVVHFSTSQDTDSMTKRVARLNCPNHRLLDTPSTQAAYPHFAASISCLDTKAGVFRLKDIRQTIASRLVTYSNVKSYYNAPIRRIQPTAGSYTVYAGDLPPIHCRYVVVTAGLWSQDVVNCMQGVPPLPLGLRAVRLDILFHLRTTPDHNIPAFAFIEHGVFGTPAIPGYTDFIKIASFYDPAKQTGAQMSKDQLLSKLLPGLAKLQETTPAHIDQCLYDYTTDGHFIVGPHPHHPNIILACGWNGGGYKFAPAIVNRIAAYIEKGDNRFLPLFSPARCLP